MARVFAEPQRHGFLFLLLLVQGKVMVFPLLLAAPECKAILKQSLSLFKASVQRLSYNPLGMLSHTQQTTDGNQGFSELQNLIPRKYVNDCEILKPGNVIAVDIY